MKMKDFAENFDTIIVFCEGLLSSNDADISSLTNAIDVLKKCGKKILYVSRDCSSSRREICEKLKKMNYKIEANDIICMTSLMANYLKKRLEDKKVYVIGSSGISEELDDVGLRNFGIGPDILTTDLATFVHSYRDDPEMGAVVVGFDEYFSYPKMLRAASYLSVTDVIHVACTERTKPTAAIIACIETCSEKKALVLDTSPSIIHDTLKDCYRIITEKTLIILPGKNNDFYLAQSQLFQNFLSTPENDILLSLDSAEKLDESSKKLIFHIANLTELVSNLNI